MKTLAFNIIGLLALGISLTCSAATFPNRWTTNDDPTALSNTWRAVNANLNPNQFSASGTNAVAIKSGVQLTNPVVNQIVQTNTGTNLTVKFIQSSADSLGAGYKRTFMVISNASVQNSGFWFMTSQETSDGSLFYVLDNDLSDPSSNLNPANFNSWVAALADSVVIGTPPGYLSDTPVTIFDSSIFGILDAASANFIHNVVCNGYATLGSATNLENVIASGFGVGEFLDKSSDDVMLGNNVYFSASGYSHDNTIIGSTAVRNATLALSNNIIIGSHVEPVTDGGGNQMNIGGTIFATGLPFNPQRNAGTAKVGINITAPVSTLDVNGDIHVRGVMTGNARPFLTNTLTYFVATNGSDSNDGLTISTPLLTIQAGVDRAMTWDFDTNNIVVQVADGVYSGSVLIQRQSGSGDWKNHQGVLFIHGDDASPTSVIITNAITNHLVLASGYANVIVGSVCVGSVTGPSANLLDAQLFSTLAISNVVIGPTAAGNAQIVSEVGGHIYTPGTVTVTGGSGNLFLALGPADIWCISNLVFSGTPAYTAGIFKAINGGAIYVIPPFSTSGSVTGSKYVLFNAGSIATLGNGSPEAVLPGSANGAAGIGLTEGGTNIFFGSYQFAPTGPVGVIDASISVPGIIGEYTNKLVLFANATNLVNNVPTNLTSMTLSAGDWDVEGAVNCTYTSATVGELRCGITSTSATIPVDGTAIFSAVQTTTISSSDSATIPRTRFNLSSPTTIFLVVQSSFSAGSGVGYGRMSARRVR